MLFSYVEIPLFLGNFQEESTEIETEKKKKKKKKKKKPPYITSLPTTLIKIYKFNFQTCLPRFLVETQTWMKKRQEDDGEKDRKKQEVEEKEEEEGIGLKN
jgi:hypothetical protein